MAGSVFLAKLNKFCKLALTLPIYSVIVNLAHYYTYDAPLPNIRTSDPCPFPSSRLPAGEVEKPRCPSPLSRKTEEDYPCLKTKPLNVEIAA